MPQGRWNTSHKGRWETSVKLRRDRHTSKYVRKGETKYIREGETEHSRKGDIKYPLPPQWETDYTRTDGRSTPAKRTWNTLHTDGRNETARMRTKDILKGETENTRQGETKHTRKDDRPHMSPHPSWEGEKKRNAHKEETEFICKEKTTCTHQQKRDKNTRFCFVLLHCNFEAVSVKVFVANEHESDLFNTIICCEILFSIFPVVTNTD